MEKFETEVCNLESICDQQYLIPTYQRPFVWKKEQIDKLLLDFWNVFIHNEEEDYFIGTVITSKRNEKFELIDGQQRFTTLWLIAFSFFKDIPTTPLKQFIRTGDNLRLSFTIRTQVEEYLKLLLEYKAVFTEKFSEQRIKSDEYLANIAEAVTTIQNMLDQFNYTTEKSKEAFGKFIFTKVLFVKNTSAQNTNLNKLFITLNNSGIQLEQTDILKANLLKNCKSGKQLYTRIWEACEKMNDFFPYNLKALFSAADWTKINIDTLASFNETFFEKGDGEVGGSDKVSAAYTLDELVSMGTPVHVGNDNSQSGTTVRKCKSILNFAQLLLHTYRIFLKQRDRDDFILPFHTNNLLNIFVLLTDEIEIKKFIRLLWKVRYLFDKYVVKWIENEAEEEELALSTVSLINGDLQWDDLEKSSLSILQSVLYHTSNPNTQIWLTPYLYSLLNKKNDVLEVLEMIDNKLSISFLEDRPTTFLLMKKNYKADESMDFVNYLNENKGTSFKHYWFQKLEYVLWKGWNRSDPRFRSYRITRKNSVEHIFPQHHEFEKILDEDQDIHMNWLNSFGNLGLINVSQNSSYSNQDVQKKKIDFIHKPTGYDSLKLAKVYNNDNLEEWGKNEIANHQGAMINLLMAHYGLIKK